MIKSNQIPILIFTLIIGGFYGWVGAFQENERLTALGINGLHIAVGILTLWWLFQAHRRAAGKGKLFWLLLGIGTVFYTSGTVLLLFYDSSQETILSEDISYLIWLLAYFLFLTALIVRIKRGNSFLSYNFNVFNIVIFMITAASVSAYFLITPALALSGNSWLLTIPLLLYTIVDLTILLVITIMYFLIQSGSEKKYMLFLITGFFLQVSADLTYSYFAYYHAYHPGHFVDLLWLFALFFIGATAFHAKNSKSEVEGDIPNPLKNKDALIPYTSIFIMLLLVIHSYQWNFNALSTGLLMIFLIVLGRQVKILRKNKSLLSHLKHLAYHDPLTGLKNRRNFMEEIENILIAHPKKQVALLLIDLDRFKVVNDTLGHHVGDVILVKTAERLQQSLQHKASVFRFGGDEFIMVLPDATEAKCVDLAKTILTAFQPPFLSKGHEINITPSIGISLFPEHGTTSEALVKKADSAMYLSKENGKNAFNFYNNELDYIMMRKLQIETELRKAISCNQLLLYYQPKVELRSSQVIGMEALLRWEHPELGWISPVEFIPVAEETRQIVVIGEWVLQRACRQNKLWQEKGLPPLCVSVNVSALQFQHEHFLESVQNALQESGLDPRYLELEITESITQNIGETRVVLESLREMGIKISVDDFGTGYSSLSLLQKLPIDTIKIDKSFIDELEENGQHSMVKTIIDLSLNLHLDVVAEGIETAGQLKFLEENGCITGQGYLFSRPVAPDAFEKKLKEIEGLNPKNLKNTIVL